MYKIHVYIQFFRKDIPERYNHVERSQFPKTVMVWDGI